MDRRSEPVFPLRVFVGLLAFTVLAGVIVIVMAGAAQAGNARAAAAGKWKVESTPNPVGAGISFLSSVACSSPQACTAVGGATQSLSTPDRMLAERWNGVRWQLQSIPTAAGTSDDLYGVSCPSARACVAVGG